MNRKREEISVRYSATCLDLAELIETSVMPLSRAVSGGLVRFPKYFPQINGFK